jgi:hypothetical protein
VLLQTSYCTRIEPGDSGCQLTLHSLRTSLVPREYPLPANHSSIEEAVTNMTHFVICENAACHFVLDISNQDRQSTQRQSIFSACPECGSNLSSTCPFFRSRSPRPMARRPPPLRLLPSQASTQSERAHATATRLHTHRKRSKAPLAIGRGVQRVLKVSLRASLIGDCVVASPSSQYFAASRARGLGSRCMSF